MPFCAADGSAAVVVLAWHSALGRMREIGAFCIGDRRLERGGRLERLPSMKQHKGQPLRPTSPQLLPARGTSCDNRPMIGSAT